MTASNLFNYLYIVKSIGCLGEVEYEVMDLHKLLKLINLTEQERDQFLAFIPHLINFTYTTYYDDNQQTTTIYPIDVNECDVVNWSDSTLKYYSYVESYPYFHHEDNTYYDGEGNPALSYQEYVHTVYYDLLQSIIDEYS